MKQTYSLKELQKNISIFSKLIQPSKTLGLTGELGSGKTSLIKLILDDLGYSGNVCSPTYNITNEYTLESLTVEHWDLYRLNELPSELLEECPGKVCRLVEWSNLIPEDTDIIDLSINIQLIDPSKRQYSII